VSYPTSLHGQTNGSDQTCAQVNDLSRCFIGPLIHRHSLGEIIAKVNPFVLPSFSVDNQQIAIQFRRRQNIVMDEHLTKAVSDITGLISKLGGPLCEEFGLILADKAREYRARNAVKIFLRTQCMLKHAGISPKAIPPRLLLPAFEASSVEDNDVLQERWAALIANAASTGGSGTVLPSFVEVLKQLTPEEAIFLIKIRQQKATTFELAGVRVLGAHPVPADRGRPLGGFQALRSIYIVGQPSAIKDNIEKLSLIVNDLVRLGILDRMPWYPSDIIQESPFSANLNMLSMHETHSPGESDYFLTPFGVAFIDACTAPLPVAQSSETRE
jgi:hypothetical protein